MEDALPDVLFKFRPLAEERDWERLEQLLVGRNLWFSSVDRFNDPFEGHVSLRMPPNDPAAQSWVKHVSRDKMSGTRDDRRQQRRNALSKSSKGFTFDGYMPASGFGVFCLMDMSQSTGHGEEILSWSHYAAGHHGIAVGFRVAQVAPLNLFSFAQQVRYFAQKPQTNILHTTKDEAYTFGVLAKADCWRYEREWRIISADMPLDHAEIRRHIELGEILEGGALHDFWRFPPRVNDTAQFDVGDVVEIRLGARLPLAERRRLAETLSRATVNPVVLQAEIHPNRFELTYSKVSL